MVERGFLWRIRLHVLDANIGRVANNHIEAAARMFCGKLVRPRERIDLLQNSRWQSAPCGDPLCLTDKAVTHPQRSVQLRQRRPARPIDILAQASFALIFDQLQQEAEPGDLNRICVDINTANMRQQDAALFLESQAPQPCPGLIDRSTNMAGAIVGLVPREVVVDQKLEDRQKEDARAAANVGDREETSDRLESFPTSLGPSARCTMVSAM